MVLKGILKRPWKSPRGRKYPVGTIFKFSNRTPAGLLWYDYKTPDGECGFVRFHRKIFCKLTEEEIFLRKIRQEIIDEHIRATADPYKTNKK